MSADDTVPCTCDKPRPLREDGIRYCGGCGDGLPQIGPKEALYDEHFSPLVAQLIALSKEHGVSLFVHCRLDGCPDSVTTSCPQPEDEEWARGFLRWARPPQRFAAYTITTGTPAPPSPRPCANCGRPAVAHWMRPGVGSMFCESAASGIDDKYDRGTLTPDEQRKSDRIESVLRAVVGVLAREEPGA